MTEKKNKGKSKGNPILFEINQVQYSGVQLYALLERMLLIDQHIFKSCKNTKSVFYQLDVAKVIYQAVMDVISVPHNVTKSQQRNGVE